MAERMGAPLLWSPKGNSRQSAPIRDDVVEIAAVHVRIKRRVHFEEDLSMRRFGTTRLQVVDQGLTDLVGQRQAQGHTGFRLRDFYCRLLPMKVVQFQCANIPSTQSQPACQ